MSAVNGFGVKVKRFYFYVVLEMPWFDLDVFNDGGT
jgi:hypothetical protein